MMLPEIIYEDAEIEKFVTSLKTKHYYKISGVLKK